MHASPFETCHFLAKIRGDARVLPKPSGTDVIINTTLPTRAAHKQTPVSIQQCATVLHENAQCALLLGACKSRETAFPRESHHNLE